MVKNLHMKEDLSDNEEDNSDIEDGYETAQSEDVPLTKKTIIKEKKPRSEKQIEAFKRAQETRKQNISNKLKEKEIKHLTEKEKNIKSKHDVIVKKKQSLMKTPKIIPEPESESEEEEQIIVVKKKKKPVKKIIIEESDSDESSEEELPKTRELKSQRNRKSLIKIVDKPVAKENKQIKVDFNSRDWFI